VRQVHPGAVATEQPDVFADSPADAPGGDLTARYGRDPGHRGRLIGLLSAVIGGALAVTVFVWTAVSFTTRDARWQDITFSVVDDSTVDVTFEVYAREGANLRCLIRAIDADNADVGQVERDIGPIEGTGARETVRIRTLREARGASVRTCVLLTDPVQ